MQAAWAEHLTVHAADINHKQTMPQSLIDSFEIPALRALYEQGQITPYEVLAEVHRRIARYNDPALFIHLLPPSAIKSQLDRLENSLPLYGIPFAIKDNINLAGHPTTAGCPAFSFIPAQTASAVERLLAAGAVLVGKTNLDQFATGLVGTRSPFGTPRNPFNSDYIPGGSSSGSAVAVSAGLVSFALGTDTAGSGRVPAAFNNIVGLKPTRGSISTAGVIPACKSLDCVSIFALTCNDAGTALRICTGYDETDAFSRKTNDWPAIRAFDPCRFQFGVPRTEQLAFFGDSETPTLYDAAIEQLVKLGGSKIEIDFAPFAQAARLLYDGPWVAERYAAIKAQIEPNPSSLLEVTRKIIEPGNKITAVDSFNAFYQLESLRKQTRATWERIDCLLLPTTGTIYRRDQVESDPIQLNTNLGYYTNFTNLLDLTAVALPAGFGKDKLPRGITIMARAGQDRSLLELGSRFQRANDLPLGATRSHLIASDLQCSIPEGWIQIGVLGAHLSGLPLNHQLLDRGARLFRTCRTAPKYRFYALPGTVPPKPGLLRVTEGGERIELEIWVMDAQSFGTFVAAVPPPLGIGTIELEDGSAVKGFLCEPFALAGAMDITDFGGWRDYLAKGISR